MKDKRDEQARRNKRDKMRIGRVIGTVTPGQLHPNLMGGQFKLVVPFNLRDLTAEPTEEEKTAAGYATMTPCERLRLRCPRGTGTELIVYDELSAGVGEWIAFSEGAEASMAFYPDNKSVDAYAAAIIDTIELDQKTIEKLEF